MELTLCMCSFFNAVSSGWCCIPFPLSSAPGDFADPIEIVLQFDGVSTSQTVTVTIENDNVLESEETFLGNLELRNQEDQQVTLAPQTAVITIVEDNADG